MISVPVVHFALEIVPSGQFRVRNQKFIIYIRKNVLNVVYAIQNVSLKPY